jgi:hypothetical protein
MNDLKVNLDYQVGKVRFVVSSKKINELLTLNYLLKRLIIYLKTTQILLI